MDATAAESLLEKVRLFIADSLSDEERALFATLLAPGIARAYPSDVDAFGIGGWSPAALPDSLVEALRKGGVRVQGLGL
jgi:hypothetical protein